MAVVLVRLVDDGEMRRGETLRQDPGDIVLHAHRASVPSHGEPAAKCGLPLPGLLEALHNRCVMDLNSPLFDRIRIKPQCDEPREAETAAAPCEHPGCAAAGAYR